MYREFEGGVPDKNFFPGLFGYCPPCAAPATSPPTDLVAVTADGNLKANRFSFPRHDKTVPSMKEFFCQHTPESKKMANTNNNNNTNNKKKNKKNEYDDCPINMKAAREAAAVNTNKFSEKGIVSFFCYHGTPMRSSIVPMVSAEQFCYYINPLIKIMKERNLKSFGLDTNCTFFKYVKSRNILPSNNIYFVTGEMHGRKHIESCQKKFLSIYSEGLGRPIYEQSEQWWALLKYAAQKWRYMSYSAWCEALEDHYRFWALRKMQGMSRLLEKQYINTRKRICEWETGSNLSAKETALLARSKEHLAILIEDAKKSIMYFQNQQQVANSWLSSSPSASNKYLAQLLIAVSFSNEKESLLILNVNAADRGDSVLRWLLAQLCACSLYTALAICIFSFFLATFFLLFFLS